jgi:hypothetical protein
LTPIESKLPPQRFAKNRERVPVPPRVGHEENDLTRPTVANLERDSTLERLAIGQPGLSLDMHYPAAATNLSVPRPEVALEGQRHFRAPAQPWMYELPKAFEKRALRSIPQWITARVRPEGQLQAHDCATRTDELDRGVWQLSSFQPTDMGMRSTNGLGDQTLAQSGTDASIAHVCPEAPQRSTDDSSSPVGRTFTRRHPRASCQRGLAAGLATSGLPMEHRVFQATTEPPGPYGQAAFLRRLERVTFQATTGPRGRCGLGAFVCSLEHPMCRSTGLAAEWLA